MSEISHDRCAWCDVVWGQDHRPSCVLVRDRRPHRDRPGSPGARKPESAAQRSRRLRALERARNIRKALERGETPELGTDRGQLGLGLETPKGER